MKSLLFRKDSTVWEEHWLSILEFNALHIHLRECIGDGSHPRTLTSGTLLHLKHCQDLRGVSRYLKTHLEIVNCQQSWRGQWHFIAALRTIPWRTSSYCVHLRIGIIGTHRTSNWIYIRPDADDRLRMVWIMQHHNTGVLGWVQIWTYRGYSSDRCKSVRTPSGIITTIRSVHRWERICMVCFWCDSYHRGTPPMKASRGAHRKSYCSQMRSIGGHGENWQCCK